MYRGLGCKTKVRYGELDCLMSYEVIEGTAFFSRQSKNFAMKQKEMAHT